MSYKKYAFLSIFCRLVTAITSMITPFLLKEIIDTMVQNPGGHVSPTVIASLSGILIWWILVYVAEFFGWRVFDIGLIGLELRVIKDIYMESFDYLQRHSYQFFTNNFSWALVRKVSKLARGYEVFIDSIVFQFFPMMVSTLIGMVIIFSENVQIGFVFLIWLVIHIAIQLILYKRKFKYDIIANEEDSNLSGHISDVVSNQLTVNSFGSYEIENKRMENRMNSWYKVFKSAYWKHPIIWSISSVGIMVTQILIVRYMIKAWEVWTISIGTILLIQIYILNLFGSLMFIGNAIKHLYQTISGASEMLDIMDIPHEIKNRTNKKIKVREWRIVLDDVEFSYVADTKVFEWLSLTIKPGERVAFVGESGAGKTSIAKLLLRLYDIQGWVISIDGQDINQVTQESLRDSISYVPQDPLLFHRSLKENISYGRPDATDEEIIAAAKMAKCHDFISKLTDGYETMVWERGIKLSWGERQRVAIARAILANHPILIMDEATSALDSESEFLIQAAMEAVMDNKTVVVIAHRLSTIMKMDRIIVMDQGKIIEHGSHKELLLKWNGIYKKLRDIQSGGFVE